MIQKYGCTTPFYLDSLRRIELPAAAYPDAARLSSALRTQFQAILDPSSDANFETNPISQHFANAALGDVSPTAGLALGHHFHFLRPMLGEPNYLRFHAPRQIERVVTLVPNSVRSGAQRDFDDLQRLIESAGLRVEDCVLQLRDNGPDAGNQGLHVKRVGTVCLDIPTAAYALRIARREGQVAEDIAAMEQRSLQQFARETEQLLQRASARHDIDVGRHALARIPTTVEEVIRIFGH
jgi:hypothetical protein